MLRKPRTPLQSMCGCRFLASADSAYADSAMVCIRYSTPAWEEGVLDEGQPPAAPPLLQKLDGQQDVAQVLDVAVDQSGVASERTCAAKPPDNPPGGTTCTGRSKSSETSSRNPPMSRRLLPGSASTRKSTSLSGRASPLATEPKTRTSNMPRLRAMARISSRRRSEER